MGFADELRTLIEQEEIASVGTSFGGSGGSRPFSITKIRNWVSAQAPFIAGSSIEFALRELAGLLPRPAFASAVCNILRFSFLIELTDLKVGSTKMKTRWLPGLILMPRPGSFEPLQGSFEPGNDPRAANYEDCLAIFERSCRLVLDQVRADPETLQLIAKLRDWYRVPYEFPLGYANPFAEPVHRPENVTWTASDDIRWLVEARSIIGTVPEPHRTALEQIERKKLEVKVYKTDRSLTGKDKTNRAKRWEVLAGDFQFATLAECWSAERKLTCDLIHFEGFPPDIAQQFYQAGLAARGNDFTRCPVTLMPLNYIAFADSVLKAKHGRSDYQIGHLIPLKRAGRHIGSNVCWQSADGNRIQGDLTLQDTEALLDGIALRRGQLKQI